MSGLAYRGEFVCCLTLRDARPPANVRADTLFFLWREMWRRYFSFFSGRLDSGAAVGGQALSEEGRGLRVLRTTSTGVGGRVFCNFLCDA